MIELNTFITVEFKLFFIYKHGGEQNLKKIGIITMYYNSKNCGGMLQAYALTKALEKMGLSSEQICVEFSKSKKQKKKIKGKTIVRQIKDLILFGRNQYIKLFRWLLSKKLDSKNEPFERFQEKVPHSKRVYDESNINECVKIYDAFITGSDQVWSMAAYHGEYFLNFVPENLYKISYAASMPDINITEEQKCLVKGYLETFDDISVRETLTVDFLSDLTKRNIECVLDPTLLLDKSDWDEICEKRLIEQDYMFCYFLNDSIRTRYLAYRFARREKLKIITIPHMCSVCEGDLIFGDKKIYDISPEKFVSLIKYAKYVVTDSFHASVFSYIYKTKFYVFERGNMTSRLSTLLNMVGEEFRLCSKTKNALYQMISYKDSDVSYSTEVLEDMKLRSKYFLQKNLCK